MNRIAAPLSVSLLAGCANGIPSITEDISAAVAESNEKIFVGIPSLMALEGTSARLDSEWMVTAAHNKPILEVQALEVYYRPTCDIALYRKAGTETTKVGKVYQNQQVTHVGYPVNIPLATGTGTYLGDVTLTNWTACVYSATSGVVMGGMSGGGVYNDNGELLGVSHGFLDVTVTWESGVSYDSPAVFLSLLAVQDWLTQITGSTYFN